MMKKQQVARSKWQVASRSGLLTARFRVALGQRSCLLLATCYSLLAAFGSQIVCDPDSDCYYSPNNPAGGKLPALLVLSCTGANTHDLDSNLMIADSLGWIMASCHASRNHRTSTDNDRDIMSTVNKLVQNYPVDITHLYICGFSGMGTQSLFEVLARPDVFRGAVTACASLRDFPLPDPSLVVGHALYLVSREKDWNLDGNRQMKLEFEHLGIATELTVTPGEHAPGDAQELLDGCRWIGQNTQ